jgi:hypothetical protein
MVRNSVYDSFTMVNTLHSRTWVSTWFVAFGRNLKSPYSHQSICRLVFAALLSMIGASQYINVYYDSGSTSLRAADENRRSPTCFLCSILRCLKNSSRTDQGLPSFVDREEQCPSSSNASTSSRSSTLLNEPPQRSTERRWSLPKIRVPVAIWELFGRRTDPVHKSNADVTEDSATTSPV